MRKMVSALIGAALAISAVSMQGGDREKMITPVAYEVVDKLAEIEQETQISGITCLAGVNLDAILEMDIPQKQWTEEEALMMATLAMAEAEGEDIIGKALVILVVLNRAESDSFPDSIEGVIFDPGQFSPVAPGHRYYTVEPNADCWAALELIENGWDESQGALYFERNTGKETWHSRNLVELYSHGMHTFYAEEDIAK